MKKYLVNGVISLLFALFLLSCSFQSKLTRTYQNQPFSKVFAAMGKPTSIDKLKDGGTIRIYQKNLILHEAPINTGQFRYDKFNSPKSTKTETYQFYVNTADVVTKVEYQCDYSR